LAHRTLIELSRPQAVIYRDSARFRVVAAGRRFGKTREAQAEVLRDMAKGLKYGYMAPTLDMARDLMWDPLLEIVPERFIRHRDATRMKLLLKNGAYFRAFGERFDRARGAGWNRFLFDEVQDIDPEAWEKVVRPSLSDLLGHASFRGTPKGKANFLYDLWERAGEGRGWSRHHFTTIQGGWVPESEIADAMHDLDARTFRQEYEASFESTGSVVYETFDDESIIDQPFIPNAPTIVTWDFNRTDIKPMVCLVVQVINGQTIGSRDAKYCLTKEFVYPATSTNEMSETVARYFGENGWSGPTLIVTGDSTGHRGESNAARTDYEIIAHHLGNLSGYYKRNPVTRATLAIVDRVTATNALFKSMDGTRRLFVDRNAKNTIEDLRRTEWAANGSGLNADGGQRTDETDALSYFAYNYHDVSDRKPTVRRRG
jgi:hypothetical protein